MTSSAHDEPVTLDLSREELWVLHAGVLDYLEREADQGNPTPDAVDLLNTVEDVTCPVLDRSGLHLVRTILVEYMADAPLRDRATCRSVLSEIRRALA